MVSYLGAFPFQNTMAPSVLTFEAMVKVVVLLTERYGKVLRRGRKDRVKLLFGSLADVGRKDIKPAPEQDQDIDKNQEPPEDERRISGARSHAAGFSVDEPVNDEYDEDEDDDLALAALESLDAIEVFKHDHRVDRTVYETRISLDTFRRLLKLLLVIAPLKPLESVKSYTSNLGSGIQAIQDEVDSIIAAFTAEEQNGGISYRAFARTISSSFPYLFEPLTALFEHLLFSKNLNLSQRRQRGVDVEEELTREPEEVLTQASLMLPGSFESAIITPSLISHMSFFLPSSSPSINLFYSGVRLHPVFSTAAHGSSLTSFSHHVLTWQSATLLLLQGIPDGSDQGIVTLGVYIPETWKSSSSTSSTSSNTTTPLPYLFQLSPKHIVLPGNSSYASEKKPNTPVAWFSTNTGIAIGCQIPPSSRSHQTNPTPVGAGSLIIDANLESAELHIAPIRHDGVFQWCGTVSGEDTPTKIRLDLYSLEVWGIIPDPAQASNHGTEPSAVEAQRAKWEFEAREVERRRNINLKTGAGDSAKESARWLLETAGIIGDQGRHFSGSV